MTASLDAGDAAQGAQTLVERIVQRFMRDIEERVLRAGARLPSIRQFAAAQRVSKFTVVEAYDRLIARGYVESRRGAGFFVKARGAPGRPAAGNAWSDTRESTVDVVWLLRNMFRKVPGRDMPGGGVLPADWLDAGLVSSSLKAIGRQNAVAFLDYGEPQGYLPLRQQLQLKLAELQIDAAPERLLTTNGVTQGLDLVAQHLLRRGDVVLVDAPSWFLMFGRFALLGARLVGVPRDAEGPDPQRLRELASELRPRMFVTVSVLHNPTCTSTSAARAFQVLRIAEEFDFTVVEDDVYCDLHPGPSVQPCIRLAALDQLRRVVYLGGFSKTLAAGLRVGFVAGGAELIRQLTDLKMLVGLTGAEFGERMVYRVLSEGHYRRHLERLRVRLAQVREPTLRGLEAVGLRPFATPPVGMFVWMDAGVDTNRLAQAMLERGYLLAPGSLFMPDQRISTWLRFNLASSASPAMLEALGIELDRLRSAPVRGALETGVRDPI